MRRQRSAAGPYLPPFNICVNKIESFNQQLNLKIVVLPLPAPDESLDDQLGLRRQFQCNVSFIESEKNPDAPQRPRELFARDDSKSVEERVGVLMKSLNEPRPGVLVMLVKGPSHVEFRAGERIEENVKCYPLCGILAQCGKYSKEEKDRRKKEKKRDNDESNQKGSQRSDGLLLNRDSVNTLSESNDDSSVESDDEDDDELSERSIIGAFCVPDMPMEVSQELITVNLVRLISECICYEEIEKYKQENQLSTTSDTDNQYGIALSTTTMSKVDDSPYGFKYAAAATPAHETRFMAIETKDLLLCPAILLECLKTLQFKMHIDHNKEATTHEEMLHCRCLRQYNKGLAAGKPKSDYYQFHMLKAGRIKDWIVSLIPDEPSEATKEYLSKRFP